jgi:HlyD family secretion protein
MTKRKRKNTLIYILVAVVILLIVFAAIKGKQRPKGVKVSAETVERTTIRETVSASGKIFPVTEVKISSDVSGEIVELMVEEGDSVTIGQVLARIDPDAFQSQVERGEATLNSAKAQEANAKANIENLKGQRGQIIAQLENAREIHTRNEKLLEDGVVSDADFEASLSTLRSLEANLRSAEASIRAAEQTAKASAFNVKSSEAALKELRTSLRRTTLYAPMNGIVSKLSVEEGERVVGTIQMTGTELMRIADLNEMEVQVEVSENDIPRVGIGDDVDIEVDAYVGRAFKGKVTQIANSANEALSASGVVNLTTDQVTNFVVTIDISPESYKDLVSPQKPYPFRPGMSATVEIFTNTLEDVLSVSIQAVGTRELEEDEKVEGANYLDDDIVEVVFVIEADTVRRAEVVTGIQDDNNIQIKSGLKEGEQVVTGPYTQVSRKLKEGETVQVVEEDDLYEN